MPIEDISFREFIALDTEQRQEYEFYIRYSLTLDSPEDHLKIGDMTEQPFGLIKDLQFDFSQGLTWEQFLGYVARITGEDIKQVAGRSLFQLCQVKKYIMNEIDRISEIEFQTLNYIPTDRELQAGIDELSTLGAYLQFRSIARALNLTIDQVKSMRYDEAFLELVTQKRISDFESRLRKLEK